MYTLIDGQQVQDWVPSLAGSAVAGDLADAVNVLVSRRLPELGELGELHGAARIIIRSALQRYATVQPGVKSQSAGPFRVELDTNDGAGILHASDWAALRDLIGAPTGRRGPRGAFPTTPDYDHLFGYPGTHGVNPYVV